MERKGEMTKALLGQKFKELVVKKSFDKITIKMITDEAGVIRPTFYNYFRDKYEVMEWLLWEDVFSSATELVKMNMARSALEMIFKKIAADKEYYARVFEVKGQNSFEDMLYHNICNLVHVVVERNPIHIKEGEIIIPDSAHFSFKKAADMMNLKIIEAKLDENYKIDVDSVKENISDNTVAIVAIAGTTELGLVDPIEELSEIAYENNIYFHVDAAFGGFSIPFLRKIGYEFPPFDFSLPGVCSITVDPHKMGLAPIPAGGILFRKKEYLEVMAVDSPYLTVKTQSTIVGTRSGAASAATYAIMKYLGNEGYEKLAGNLMDNTHYFKEGLEKIGYDVVVEPELNIVAFNHPDMEAHDLADKLEDLGWRVSVAKCPVAIRVVLMNHITKQHLTDLLDDLTEIY